MRWCVNRWHGATIGRHSLSHARWACQLPQRGSRGGAFSAPSLRELSSEARLRECTSMNVSGQKFQSQYELVCKPLAWWNHRGTLPQSRPFGRASSLREGAGEGCVPFNRPVGNRNVAGDFHRPYGGRVPFNAPLRNRKIAGDFHRPYGTQNVLHSTIQPSAKNLPYRNHPKA